ncbi:beta-lactamase family protein [Mucilaginibacter sp. RS28]|uniref:Beta-lactamase family protein n=1 Tax=Mucilaginibacter straminoryzae TaxID=2932774 RepID=A0A9X1XAR5_9SPHI|nr:serine hydrolase domain-containing protein [Mucilaginibacter straminoryzae]MCJ8211339.1 beta-lactamase family protein [Mucilaginibacter straminoryzae]
MKITSSIVWVLLTICLSIPAVAQKAPLSPGSRLDSLISKKMEQKGIVGIGAAIIVNKNLVWKKGYGYADRELKKPFTTSTIMNIASVSKTITGACMMKAIEQGKINLDEDINHYLPFKIVNPYFPQDVITLRQLATHTSSLTDRYPFYTDSTYFNGKDSPEELATFLKNYFVQGGRYYSKENFLDHKPGTCRDYSNIGAALAGYIVENKTGEKLNIYSRRYLFKPLGMQHTSWFLSETNLANHSKLYDKKDGQVVDIPLYGCTTYPDGGLRTTVEDLAKFYNCLLNDGKQGNKQILQKRSVQEMLRLQFSDNNKPENVNPKKLNSGLFWSTKMGGERIGHNGSDPGVRTFMLSDLNKEVAVILFVNTSLGEKEEDTFFEIYNLLYKFGKTLKNAPR